MNTPDPGGDILRPGAIEHTVDQVVERQYLFKPKDEEVPPNGGNWFEHNYKPLPVAMSIRIQIDPKLLADQLDPFIQNSNMNEVLALCRKAKIEVVAMPNSPIVTLKLVP